MMSDGSCDESVGAEVMASRNLWLPKCNDPPLARVERLAMKDLAQAWSDSC